MARDKSFVVDVKANVEVRDANRAPKLIFSFPGLDDPENLWNELIALGWNVPERPPHPEAEINWDDQANGHAYAVLPYQVEDFLVEAHKWPPNEVAERGLETINTLRRLGVNLNVPIAYLDFLRRTQVAMLRNPTKWKRPVEKPTKIPLTVFLSKQPWSALVDEPKIKVYETAAAPNQPKLYWAESEDTVDSLFGNQEQRTQMLRAVGAGWELMSRMEAPSSIEGRDRILRFVVRDLRDGTDMLNLLKRNVGDSCASLLMRPIVHTDAVDNCLLIVSIVPEDRFSEVGQLLIAQFTDAIGRGRRYVPASNEDAA